MDTRIHKGLVIAGSVTFGATYLLTVLMTSMYSRQDDLGAMYIPVVGPLIMAGSQEVTSSLTVPLVLDSLAQTAGLAMLIAGFATKVSYLRYSGVALELTPVLHPGYQGMVLGTRF